MIRSKRSPKVMIYISIRRNKMPNERKWPGYLHKRIHFKFQHPFLSLNFKHYHPHVSAPTCTLHLNITPISARIPRPDKPFPCPYCQKGFNSKHPLKVHVEAVHLGLKPYTCPYCSSAFNQPANLCRHRKTCAMKLRRRLLD